MAFGTGVSRAAQKLREGETPIPPARRRRGRRRRAKARDTTATDMLAPGPLTTDANGDPCQIDVPVAILDGATRDRCPYIGDEAVTAIDLASSSRTDTDPHDVRWLLACVWPDSGRVARTAASIEPFHVTRCYPT